MINTESLQRRAANLAIDIKLKILSEMKNLKTVKDPTASNEFQLTAIKNTVDLLEIINPCCIACTVDKIGLVENTISLSLITDGVKTDGEFARAWLSCFNNTAKEMRPKVDAIVIEAQGRNN